MATSAQSNNTQQLKRSLTMRDLIVYGLIFMGPLAPMGIYGDVVQASHGMIVLTYLVSCVVMLFTAYSYFYMSKEFPSAGSAYAYIQHGLNPHIGFLAGWMILLDYILIPALNNLIAASWMHAWMPSIPNFVWILLFVIINTVVNIRGVKLAMTVSWIVFLAEFVFFLLFSVLAVIYVIQGKASFSAAPIYQPHGFSPSLIASGMSIAVLSFLGFDGISTLAEETKSKRSIVGKATVWSLIIVSIMYIVFVYLGAIVHPNYNTFPNLDVAFYYVLNQVGGPWMQTTVIVLKFFSAICCGMAAQAAISRLLFSMGRDRVLPNVLSKVHRKYKTPIVAILLVAIVAVIIGYVMSIGNLSRLVNFGAITTFIVLNITVIIYFFIRKKSGKWWQHLIMPLLGFIILLYVWINFDKMTFYLGITWFVIGCIILFINVFILKKSGKDLKID
ncbi:APC family permease [Scopulibacillus cellulosilyticus]|uniref:APC family permease n=1 Tax=Scopulibacillus cellulosilyticus TaxID=2665665 RepID=A0ABW2Q687_9BACL